MQAHWLDKLADGWFTAVVLYVLIWWVALFAVLPVGTRPQAEPDPVTGWRGTPERPRMGRKVLITTLVALVIWFFAEALILSDYLSFRNGFMALPAQ